jgi:hypothetical protein
VLASDFFASHSALYTTSGPSINQVDDVAVAAFVGADEGMVRVWSDQATNVNAKVLYSVSTAGAFPYDSIGPIGPCMGFINHANSILQSQPGDGTWGLSGSPALTIAWAGDWRLGSDVDDAAAWVIGNPDDAAHALLCQPIGAADAATPGAIEIGYATGVSFACDLSTQIAGNGAAPNGQYWYILTVPAGAARTDITLEQNGVSLTPTVSPFGGSLDISTVDGMVRLGAQGYSNTRAEMGVTFFAVWNAVLGADDLTALRAHLNAHHAYTGL